VTLDVGFYVSQTLFQNQSTKNLSVAASIRIAASRSNAYRTPSTVTSIVDSPTFSPPTAPFHLKSKPQLSPYIQTSTAAAPQASQYRIQPLLTMSACRLFSTRQPIPT
jgi:hypothetical protein